MACVRREISLVSQFTSVKHFRAGTVIPVRYRKSLSPALPNSSGHGKPGRVGSPGRLPGEGKQVGSIGRHRPTARLRHGGLHPEGRPETRTPEGKRRGFPMPPGMPCRRPAGRGRSMARNPPSGIRRLATRWTGKIPRWSPSGPGAGTHGRSPARSGMRKFATGPPSRHGCQADSLTAWAPWPSKGREIGPVVQHDSRSAR